MDPITLTAIITTGVPLATALFKRIFKTENLAEKPKAVVHQVVPLLVGLASGILTCKAGLCSGELCPASSSWTSCVLYGIACGAGGSYLRDFDKNITGIAQAVGILAGRKA